MALERVATKSSGRNQSVPRSMGRTVPSKDLLLQDQARSTISGVPPIQSRQEEAIDGSVDMDTDPHEKVSPQLCFKTLPSEIQESVLDYLFGDLLAVMPTSSGGTATRVSAAMRHPRRKELSNMALVSTVWRSLVQGRIFRHIKIKGTKGGLTESQEFFLRHPHLVRHVRHIEVWIPVWGERSPLVRSSRVVAEERPTPEFSQQMDAAEIFLGQDISLNFRRSTYNATLSEIFSHVNCFFPDACIFTLEGGHCRNARAIRHFEEHISDSPSRNNTGNLRCLERLPNIRTFVMKGAWNIMRDYAQWQTMEEALPNLQEWHCNYAQLNREAYKLMTEVFLKMPSTVRRLSISMEGLPSKEPSYFQTNPYAKFNHCEQLGKIAHRLESISFTGKLCMDFFRIAAAGARHAKGDCRLRSIDLGVLRTCMKWTSKISPKEAGFVLSESSPGLNCVDFIREFEVLTASCVRSLEVLPLTSIRIRYIDLDSSCPQLNPYFQVVDNVCYGLWNEDILELLPTVRPGLRYAELNDGINSKWTEQVQKREVCVRSLYPTRRPKAIKSSVYKIMTDAGRGSPIL